MSSLNRFSSLLLFSRRGITLLLNWIAFYDYCITNGLVSTNNKQKILVSPLSFSFSPSLSQCRFAVCLLVSLSLSLSYVLYVHVALSFSPDSRVFAPACLSQLFTKQYVARWRSMEKSSARAAQCCTHDRQNSFMMKVSINMLCSALFPPSLCALFRLFFFIHLKQYLISTYFDYPAPMLGAPTTHMEVTHFFAFRVLY